MTFTLQTFRNRLKSVLIVRIILAFCLLFGVIEGKSQKMSLSLNALWLAGQISNLSPSIIKTNLNGNNSDKKASNDRVKKDENQMNTSKKNYNARPFITRWDMSKLGNDGFLSFDMQSSGEVNYSWTMVPAGISGSGIIDHGNIFDLPTNGIIELQIFPANFDRMNMSFSNDQKKLISIEQWGDVAWTSMGYAFSGCSNMKLNATDIPNTSAVSDMSYMFQRCSSFNQALPEGFNTSAVTDMSGMFSECSTYNKALPNSFNTSTVEYMSGMFSNCYTYNKALPSSFNVASVIEMGSMFENCSAFNQNLAAYGPQLNDNVNLYGFLDYSGMSLANYDATLTGFRAGTATGRTMGAAGLKYCLSESDRSILVGQMSEDGDGKGWTITGDELFCPNAPIMGIRGNDISIRNNDTKPSAENHTDFGSIDLSSGNIVRTFTIENTGLPLTLSGTPLVAVSGANASDFVVTQMPTTSTLAAYSGTTTFQVTFTPSAAGTRMASISIDNDATGEEPFRFDIKGFGGTKPFITRWDLSKNGNENYLNLALETSGDVNYSWTTVPAGRSGSGIIVNGEIFNLPTNGIIELQIFPANFHRVTMAFSSDRQRLISIEQWGDVAWSNMNRAFSGCSNMKLNATDIPNTSAVSDMSYMFENCSSFNQAFPEGFNTSVVADMIGMFSGCITYNKALPNSFSVASATNMSYMFFNCEAFNKSLASWGNQLQSNVNLGNFLDNSGMGLANYDATLTSFNAGTATQVNMGANGLKYCLSTEDRTNLIGEGKGWTITGDAPFCPTTPIMSIRSNELLIQNGDNSPRTEDNTDFGSVNLGSSSIVRTFTIENTGTELTLTNETLVDIIGANAGDFTVTAFPTSPLAAYNGSSTFQVIFTPSAMGVRTAEISIISNDPNLEGSYIFTLKGTATSSPEINIKGNEVSIADGDDTPFIMDNTDFGSQNVSSGSISKTFTIENTGSQILNLTNSPNSVIVSGTNSVDFTLTVQPTSPVDATTGSTTFEVTFNPSAAGLRTASISIANNDADENPYNFVIQGTGSLTLSPEINIKGNDFTIADGDDTPSSTDHTDFGLQNVSSGSISRTFIIENTGSQILNLINSPNKVIVSGIHSEDFTVSVQPTSPIDASTGSTTFELTFNPSAAEKRKASISIANDDDDENPYTFDIVGTGTDILEPTLVNASHTSICAGNPILLSATCESGIVIWYNQALGGESIGSGSPLSQSPNETITYFASCKNEESESSRVATNQVTVNPTPKASASSNSPICDGNTLNLISRDVGTYSWSAPNDFTSTDQNPSISNATVSATGIYTLTITNASSCSATASVAVTVNATPKASASSNSPICDGNTLNLTSRDVGTYSWSGPNDFTSTDQNPSISNATVSAAGTYTLTVTNESRCSVTATTSVIVNPKPSIPILSADNLVICKGGSVIITGTCSSITDIFRWSTTTLNQNGILPLTNSNTRIVTEPGTYRAFCESSFSCVSAEANIIITQSNNCNGQVFLAISPENPVICPNSSITLSASGCAGFVSWLGGTNTVTGTTATFSPAMTTTYLIQCSTGGSATVTIGVAQANAVVDLNISTGKSITKAVSSIESDKKIGNPNFTPAPNVTYEAGNSILLKPGFVVEKWSTFKAEIKGCN